MPRNDGAAATAAAPYCRSKKARRSPVSGARRVLVRRAEIGAACAKQSIEGRDYLGSSSMIRAFRL